MEAHANLADQFSSNLSLNPSTMPSSSEASSSNNANHSSLENEELALMPIEEAQHSAKQGRPTSPFSSPKKLKLFLDTPRNGKMHDMLTKKVKVLEFYAKFLAKSLGLIETPGGMLVPKEGMMPLATIKQKPAEVVQKKKRGRPFGSKNKNPPKTKKVPAKEVLHVLYSGHLPSPSVKGKDKM